MNLAKNLKFLPTYRYQDETLTYRSGLLGIGGSIAERSLQHLDKFIRDAKEAALYTKLNYFIPFVGADLTSALLAIRPGSLNLAATGVNLVAGDYSEATGYTGNGTTKYIDTNVGALELASDDIHICVYHRAANNQAGNRLLGGASDATDHYWLGALTTTSNADGRLGKTTTATGGSSLAAGFYTISRRSATSLVLYRNGTALNTSTTVTVGALPAQNIYCGAYNNAGTAAGFVNTPISFFSVGYGLTTQNVTDLYALVQTLQTNLGRQV